MFLCYIVRKGIAKMKNKTRTVFLLTLLMFVGFVGTSCSDKDVNDDEKERIITTVSKTDERAYSAAEQETLLNQMCKKMR